MKTPAFIACLSIAFLAGCGQKDASSAAPNTPTGPRVIEITAGDTMKFSVTSIEATPGESLDVILTNIGTVPKEAMGHNWVLLKADADAAAFATAGQTAQATGYIPAALADEIIAHIDLLGPRKSGEVTFKAPTVPGTYPFLCTFPAHYLSGMKGTLVVK